MRTYTKVTVLVPTYNEQNYIANCLNSLLLDEFGLDQLEILVIDGGSTDQTCKIVTEFTGGYPQIKLLHNPEKIVSTALNLGAKMATGEILIWVGAHAHYAPTYISRSVELLVETGAASVGGRITAIGEGRMGKAIAFSLSLPIGTGNAQYRSGDQAQWVDTVFGGCWWKQDFLSIGGFDQRWVVNQDTEFNYRLRTQIGGIYFSPDITCDYFVRGSLAKLARQYFRYGVWRAKTVLRHRQSVRLRQILPVLLVTGLALSVAILPWSSLPIVSLLVLYSATLILVLTSLKKIAFSTKFLAFLSTATMHICWGSGFVIGLIVGQPTDPVK